jgi:apolipoprotein N-acyltransferase
MNTRPEAPPLLDTLAARVPNGAWLALGVLFMALAGNRFGVGVVGWVAAVPWLVHLRRTTGWKARLLLFGALQVGAFLNIAKIITDPLPWFFALMFSIPTAIGAFLGYLAFEALRRRLGDRWGVVLFPALVVLLEWVSASTSEMGSWGALIYTQLGNPQLLQTAALFGFTTVGLLLSAVSALLAVVLDSPTPRRWLPAGAALATVVLAAHTYGAVRLDRVLDGPSVRVATVTSDTGPGPEGLPSADLLAQATETLFERSVEAAHQGAQVVVWNEGATSIEPADEAAFLDRGRALARAHNIDLVLGYIVPLDGLTKFENKYVWLAPDADVETYLKHHPVPGEGSIRGTAPIVVHDRPYGKAAGAICYDYDFPALGLEHARQEADLVVVPSSDWRGIDPFHTQMAAVRGIEGGFSVVRSVRWATSGAFDPMGRVRGTVSYFEGQRMMVANVPSRRVPTLYSRLGDVLPLFAGLVLLGGLAMTLVRTRRPAIAAV